MSRKRTSERLPEVARAASRLLAERGYEDFHMADLAADFNLTEAALYRYVDGKDALVHAAFQICLFPDAAEKLKAPLPNPGRKATVQLVDSFLRISTPLSQLRLRFEAKSPRAGAAHELEHIVRQIYQSLFEHRERLRLIERIALEWPEMHRAWHGGARAQFFAAFAGYLSRRAAQKHFVVPDGKTTCALVTEMIYHAAVVRHYERFPAPIDPDKLEDSIAALVVNGIVAR